MSATQEQVEMLRDLAEEPELTASITHEEQEAIRALLREREELQAQVVRHKKWHRQPTHGPCCTCQHCGLFYDECRCDLDEVADKLEKAEARVSELEAQLQAAKADASFIAYWQGETESARLQLAASEEARKRAEEKLARLAAKIREQCSKARSPEMQGIKVGMPWLIGMLDLLLAEADQKGEA